jgi:hypothetical protein
VIKLVQGQRKEEVSSSRKGMKLKEGKRKFFRFPIYDDIDGLKLKAKKSCRIIFEGDDFITNHIHDRPTSSKEESAIVDSYDTDHVYKNKVSSSTKMPKITVNSSNNEVMKINRPTSKRFTKTQDVSSRNMSKQPLCHAKKYTSFQNRNLEKNIVTKKKEFRHNYSQELQRENSMFTKNELLSSMHKDLESFILFDDKKPCKNLQEENLLLSIKAKTKDKQARVLNRGLAGIFAEESKGINKVKNKFFTD